MFARKQMVLNEINFYVKALTDVTGFGLFGHLVEMADGSGLSAKIDFDALPLLPNIQHYLDQKCFPGGTSRNLASYSHRLSDEFTESQRFIGADPQTSGGLLIAVEAEHTAAFEEFALSQGLELSPIGELIHAKEKAIYLA